MKKKLILITTVLSNGIVSNFSFIFHLSLMRFLVVFIHLKKSKLPKCFVFIAWSINTFLIVKETFVHKI